MQFSNSLLCQLVIKVHMSVGTGHSENPAIIGIIQSVQRCPAGFLDGVHGLSRSSMPMLDVTIGGNRDDGASRLPAL